MAAAKGGGGEREAGRGGCPAGPAGEVLRDTAGDPLRRLRKAEAVLARRTRRLVVVLEKSRESRDHEALLRTCECLGIQHVFIIVHAGEQVSRQAVPAKKLRAKDRRGPWVGSGILKKSSKFLTLKLFETVAECAAHCRAEGMEIWAVVFDKEGDGAACVRAGVALPPGRRVAVVFGKEGGEVSDEFAVDKRIRYSPRGPLGAGLSMSAHGAVLLQRLQDTVRGALGDGLLGDLGPAEKERLRAKWYATLAKTPQQKEEFLVHLVDPPEPLGDLRMPEELRVAIVPKKFVRQRERGREEAAAAARPEPRPPARA